jgi:hypothetical protein
MKLFQSSSSSSSNNVSVQRKYVPPSLSLTTLVTMMMMTIIMMMDVRTTSTMADNVVGTGDTNHRMLGVGNYGSLKDGGGGGGSGYNSKDAKTGGTTKDGKADKKSTKGGNDNNKESTKGGKKNGKSSKMKNGYEDDLPSSKHEKKEYIDTDSTKTGTSKLYEETVDHSQKRILRV